jgi:predicted DCC family thiol-disulfide oxidoreductase YuxK
MKADLFREPHSYRHDPANPGVADDRPIIVFDGYCALCSAWARFVLRHDRRAIYRLLPAQSILGRALYVHYGLDPENHSTNMLIAEGIAWFKSEGSIRMAEGLGFPWSLATLLRMLPLGTRDGLYDLLARNRYRLGRREVCFVPDPGDTGAFYDWTGAAFGCRPEWPSWRRARASALSGIARRQLDAFAGSGKSAARLDWQSARRRIGRRGTRPGMARPLHCHAVRVSRNWKGGACPSLAQRDSPR